MRSFSARSLTSFLDPLPSRASSTSSTAARASSSSTTAVITWYMISVAIRARSAAWDLFLMAMYEPTVAAAPPTMAPRSAA